MPAREIQETQETQPDPEMSSHEDDLPPVDLTSPKAGTSRIGQPKKRYRPSKREIPDYPFTEEDKELMVEFIKAHPTLYDKRDRQWSNPRRKEEL